MEKIKLLFAITLILVIPFTNACKHKEDVSRKCIAGSGGHNTVVVYAYHVSAPLLNYFTHPDTAFVKFGSTGSPGIHPSDYDTFFVSEPGEDHIHCMGLKCGNYFIYRTAWDSIANITRYGGSGISLADTNAITDLHIAVN